MIKWAQWRADIKIIAETEHTYSCNQYFVAKAASYFLEWNYPEHLLFLSQ